MKTYQIEIFVIFSLLCLLAAGCQAADTVTPIPTKAMTQTPSFTLTIAPTETPTPTLTPEPTQTPTLTPTIVGGYPGKYVMFGRSDEEQVWYLMDASGKSEGTIFQAPFDDPENLLNYSEIKWSSTGETLAVLYYREGGILTLLRSDGTVIKTMELGINSFGGHAGQINWSPDGQWLVFPSQGENYYLDIYMIDSNGENLRQLTNTIAKESSPIFLPDGKAVIFYNSGSKSGQILDLITGESTYGDYVYSWSPDGQHYVTDDPTLKGVLIGEKGSWKRAQIFSVWDDVIPSTENNDLWVGDTFFSPDGEWVFIRIYLASALSPLNGMNFIYRVNVLDPNMKEFIGTGSYNFSFDQSMLVFYGCRAIEDLMCSQNRIYLMSFDGTEIIPLDQKAVSFSDAWQPNSAADPGFDASMYLGPTLAPTWVTYEDAPLYDAFDGEQVDPVKWEQPVGSGSSDYSWQIYKGGLNIRSKAANKNEGAVFSTSTFYTLENLKSFSSKVLLWSVDNSSYAKIQISGYFTDKKWWTQCRLGKSDFVCEVITSTDGNETIEYKTRTIETVASKWYEMKIELNQDTGALQFYLDGEIIGTYGPADAPRLLDQVKLIPKIGVWDTNGQISASFDDVRIGQ